MTLASLKVEHKCGYSYFPALPTIDRRVRYSGEFVRWFLTENSYWVERYRELLENAEKVSRQRRRQWYEYGPPHTLPFVAAPHPKEVATLRVRDLAEMTRIPASSNFLFRATSLTGAIGYFPL